MTDRTILSVSVPTEASEQVRALLTAALTLNGFAACRVVVLATLNGENECRGFYGYDDCPLLDPRSEGSCPTPLPCFERGACGATEWSSDG